MISRQLALIATLGGAALAAVLGYLLTGVAARLAWRWKAVDQPTGGRKIHRVAIPLFGGVGIVAAIFFLIILARSIGFISSEMDRQLVGYCLGLVVLFVGGMVDDIRALPASRLIIFPLAAAGIVVASGTSIALVTAPFGSGVWSLDAWQWQGVPVFSYALTVLWLLVATYATKMMDGLDGLVTGISAIGAAMVGALTVSPSYFQPSVGILSGIVGGAFAGFLPRNFHPARQFLGEVGSTAAGFSLGFLAIVSSAKVAIALAVLAIPIADIVRVVIGRVRRGVVPWQGDDTHLHFRLLQSGLTQTQAVIFLWAVSLAAGLAALSLQTRGKLFLVGCLIVFTFLVAWLTRRRAKPPISS